MEATLQKRIKFIREPQSGSESWSSNSEHVNKWLVVIWLHVDFSYRAVFR